MFKESNHGNQKAFMKKLKGVAASSEGSLTLSNNNIELMARNLKINDKPDYT